jgi:predicted transcriptional regulator
MKLARYLSDHRISQAAFAELIGKTQPAVNRYVRGLRVPDTATIKLIETATGGRVQWRDWHPDIARHLSKSLAQPEAIAS